MDQEPEKKPDTTPYIPPKPVIPPPDLSRPPPPPLSPLESLPKTTPPRASSLPENTAAKVNLGGAVEDAPTQGIAPFNSRIIAAVVDMVVATGVMIGLSLILPGFADRLAYLVGLAYLVTRDSLPFLGGQSVGKKAMKLKVVTLEGKSIVGNWEAAIIRNGVLLIPLFGLVELFILLSREDKAERGVRLGDEWAKTRVMPDDKPAAPEEIG